VSVARFEHNFLAVIKELEWRARVFGVRSREVDIAQASVSSHGSLLHSGPSGETIAQMQGLRLLAFALVSHSLRQRGPDATFAIVERLRVKEDTLHDCFGDLFVHGRPRDG